MRSCLQVSWAAGKSDEGLIDSCRYCSNGGRAPQVPGIHSPGHLTESPQNFQPWVRLTATFVTRLSTLGTLGIYRSSERRAAVFDSAYLEAIQDLVSSARVAALRRHLRAEADVSATVATPNARPFSVELTQLRLHPRLACPTLAAIQQAMCWRCTCSPRVLARRTVPAGSAGAGKIRRPGTSAIRICRNFRPAQPTALATHSTRIAPAPPPTHPSVK